MNVMIASIPAYLSKQISDLVSSDPSVINLSIGEPYFKPPEILYQNFSKTPIAIGQDLDSISNKYAESRGSLDLRNAIATWYKRNYGAILSAEENVLVTHGACEAIWLSILTLTSLGDEVIIADPSYMLYEIAVKLVGRIPVKIPTSAENGFCLTVKQIEDALTARTKMILINSPENPTGAVYSAKAIKELHELAKKTGIQFVHDEVYDTFVFNAQHENVFRYQTNTDSASVLINSFSKKFSMMGWRIGWTVGTKEYINNATKVHTNLTLNLGSFHQECAATILNHETIDEYLHDHVRIIENNIKILKAALTKKAGFTLSGDTPKGALFLFPEISELYAAMPDKYKDSASKGECVARYLLQEHKIAVVPGMVYGKAGNDYIRVVGAVEEDKAKEAAYRFSAISKLMGESVL